MINQQLLDYIYIQKQSGISDTTVKQTLLANGWAPTDVDGAFASLTTQGATPDSRVAVPTATMSYADANVTVQKMGKFRASWRLFKQSLALLQQDKG